MRKEIMRETDERRAPYLLVMLRENCLKNPTDEEMRLILSCLKQKYAAMYGEELPECPQ